MFASETPPVGMKDSPGKTAAYDFSVPAPPKFEAGKNFRVVSRSLEEAAITSEGVTTPGRYRTFLARHRSPTRWSKPGETTKSAPLSTAMSTCCGVSTVPAPTQTPSTSLHTSRMASGPQDVRKVISATSMPPSFSALHNGTACATSSILMTGMTLHAETRLTTSSWLAGVLGGAFRPSALALAFPCFALALAALAGMHSDSQ
mmetsp:Transcript_87252/g.267041  ORF Transcript_87252/g.267041 Transcript_87252/m.267041 type:complete len:203 (-) Transcript_87252:54-662(-)